MGFLFRLFNSGYDRDGYNLDGYDCDGYDRDGYDRDGYNRSGYDRDRYYRDWYDRDGYDCYGYNRDGNDRNGYCRKDYDHWGYNCYGIKRNGYNRDSNNRDNHKLDDYDLDGYNRDGYDRDGHNRKGFDWDGYDRHGYNDEGYNRVGVNKEVFQMWRRPVMRTKRTLLEIAYYDFIKRNKERFDECPRLEFYSPVMKKSFGLGESIVLVDLHGLHLKDAREVINVILDSASTEVGMIMVIHGYKSGKVIRNMLQGELKHVKIKKKTCDNNPGRTCLYLK